MSALAFLAAGASSSAALASEDMAQSASPVFVPCILDGRVLSRPPKITFRCAQWNFYFSDLHWLHWRASGARAVGLVHANSCAPPNGCAGGHYRVFQARLLLGRPIECERDRHYS